MTVYLTNRFRDGNDMVLHFKFDAAPPQPFQIILMRNKQLISTLDMYIRNGGLYESKIALDPDILGKHIQIVFKNHSKEQVISSFTLPCHLFYEVEALEHDLTSYYETPISSNALEEEASTVLQLLMEGRDHE